MRMQRIQWVLCLMLLCSALAWSSMALAQSEGETLFQTTCVACHTVGEGRRVGPDLGGVHERRTEAWMRAFIKSSQSMVASGDKDAVAVFEENNKVIMPDQPLSDAQIDAVLAFIKAKGPAQAAVVVPTLTFTEEEVELGRQLFQGTIRLANRGPTCNSCHHVKNDAVIGGGVLAKELTTVFSRMHGQGVTAILGSPPFPVMQQAYREKPLMPDEVQALTAFLQYADENHYYQQPRDYGMRLFTTGLAGTFVLFGLYGTLWYRRKRHAVNHDIFKRQDEQLKQRDE